jgi:hypothetical protein
LPQPGGRLPQPGGRRVDQRRRAVERTDPLGQDLQRPIKVDGDDGRVGLEDLGGVAFLQEVEGGDLGRPSPEPPDDSPEPGIGWIQGAHGRVAVAAQPASSSGGQPARRGPGRFGHRPAHEDLRSLHLLPPAPGPGEAVLGQIHRRGLVPGEDEGQGDQVGEVLSVERVKGLTWAPVGPGRRRTLDLEVNGRTEVRIHQSNVPEGFRRVEAQAGFKSSLDRFAAHLATL